MLQIDAWIEFPYLRSGLRVKCDDMVVGRTQEELSVGQDGRGFESRLADHARRLIQRARPIRPRDFQLRHVRAIDLRRRRVASAAGIVPVRGPSGIRLGLSACLKDESREKESENEKVNRAAWICVFHGKKKYPGQAASRLCPNSGSGGKGY